MSKISLLKIALTLLMAVFLVGTNVGCGGDSGTPQDANTVAQTESPGFTPPVQTGN